MMMDRLDVDSLFYELRFSTDTNLAVYSPPHHQQLPTRSSAATKKSKTQSIVVERKKR